MIINGLGKWLLSLRILTCTVYACMLWFNFYLYLNFFPNQFDFCQRGWVVQDQKLITPAIIGDYNGRLQRQTTKSEMCVFKSTGVQNLLVGVGIGVL